MAIVTDQTVTVHGVEIGISKPIQTLIANGDFTYAELSKFAIVGRHDFVNDKAGIFEPDTYSYMAGTAAAIQALGKYPVTNNPGAPNWDTIDYIYNGSGERNADNYGKMVLVYNMVSSAKEINKNFNDSNTACIVTEFNPRLIKMMGTINAYTETATVGEPGTYTRYDVEASRSFVWMDDDTAAPFASLCIQNFEDGVYFDFPLYDNVYTANQTIAGNRDSMYVQLPYDFDDYMQTGNKLLSVWAGDGVEDFMQGANYSNSFFGVNNLSNDRGNKIICVSYTAYPDYNAIAFVRPSDLDTALKQLAGCGFYFEANGTVYKPITTDGIVTGYTADLSKNGEWDLINDVTGNSIPDKPSGGGGDEGDEDNDDTINTTGAPFSSGIARYYITTAGSVVLQHISEALGAWDLKNTGKDLFKNLISCKLIKPPTAVPSSSGVFTIYGEKPQYNGADITIAEVTGNADITFGPYSIPRKFNDFRDFSPYSKAEIFLPYCGWCGLPSHVIGRSVTVKYFTDIIAATCKAIVFCGNNVVAEAAGSIGCDIPMAADNVGMKMAGATTGLLAIVSGGIQTGAGAFNLMTGNIGRGIGGVLSGLSKVASGYTQSAMSLNENATEICGKNGDGCCIAGTTHIIIKITRPKKGAYTTAPYVPSGFAHSTGFLSNKEVTVGSVSGLLIADNVDTSGIGGATDAERAEIKRVLESGLIVNSAPVPPEP